MVSAIAVEQGVFSVPRLKSFAFSSKVALKLLFIILKTEQRLVNHRFAKKVLPVETNPSHIATFDKLRFDSDKKLQRAITKPTRYHHLSSQAFHVANSPQQLLSYKHCTTYMHA